MVPPPFHPMQTHRDQERKMSEQPAEFHRFALKFMVMAILAAAVELAVLHGIDSGDTEVGHAEWVRNVPVLGIDLPFT
ncbi:hypothetical protein A6A40_22295 (plasmid) [Azospirillum humicireducens]|uniref:Uncharacterized protein n=1 Tax=Azospirillum humicireducens TaxID=1226968 RepID=A0A2R4VTF3_9PROT|nr:hypothetical protein [Azospirillum humicireducens]AWB07715.1 hypothetical protein A6A40_22295 [Azospirillum humicireducens]